MHVLLTYAAAVWPMTHPVLPAGRIVSGVVDLVTAQPKGPDGAPTIDAVTKYLLKGTLKVRQ